MENSSGNMYNHIKPKVKLPNFRNVQNAYQIYKPDFQSINFLSEVGRTCVAEDLMTITSNYCDIPKLSTLVKNYLMKQFNGEDERFLNNLTDYDKILLGEICDVHLPLEKIYAFDNEVYWKRVVEKCAKDKIDFLRNCHTHEFSWKQLGIEIKLAQLLETTKPEYWNWINLPNLLSKCEKFVKRLTIRQLYPNRNVNSEKNEHKAFENVKNIHYNDCVHGSLEILSNLTSLNELNIQFGSEDLGWKYHRKFFKFSTSDVQNLANGLGGLQSLHAFRLRFSKMNEEKIKILIRGLLKCSLSILEISYCDLGDLGAKSIGSFLTINRTIEEIELKENLIGVNGCRAIGEGIQKFQGTLEYLGLAGNPMGEDGVLVIGVAIFNTNHLKRLNLIGCDVGEAGGFLVSQLIGVHLILEEYQIDCIPLSGVCGPKIIEGLEKNKNLCKLGVRGCNLNESDEIKIRILIERNNYHKSNPCLDKSVITENDVEEIVSWTKIIRNPILLRVNAMDDGKVDIDEKSFIKFKSANSKLQSTSELLSSN